MCRVFPACRSCVMDMVLDPHCDLRLRGPRLPFGSPLVRTRSLSIHAAPLKISEPLSLLRSQSLNAHIPPSHAPGLRASLTHESVIPSCVYASPCACASDRKETQACVCLAAGAARRPLSAELRMS